MAAITWNDVVAVAAELAAVPPPSQAIWLDLANAWFAAAVFGGEDDPRLKAARALLAAHFAAPMIYATADGSPTAGPVTSESTGGISRSYATGASLPSDWNTTSYGQRLQLIIGTLPRARLFSRRS